MFVLYSSLYCLWTRVCAVPGPVCVSVLQQSVLLEVSGLQQLVLLLDMSFQQQPVLCQEVYGLQQLVLHLDCLPKHEPLLHVNVYVYKSFFVRLVCLSTISCAALMHVRLQEPLCCLWSPGRVCLQELMVHLCVSVYIERLCCTWTCLPSGACATLRKRISKWVES